MDEITSAVYFVGLISCETCVTGTSRHWTVVQQCIMVLFALGLVLYMSSGRFLGHVQSYVDLPISLIPDKTMVSLFRKARKVG